MSNSSAGRAISIRSVTPHQAGAGPTVAGVVDIYRDVFGRPPYNEPDTTAAAFGERLQKESVREGWRLLLAEEGDIPLGFIYGYATRPGQWWHDTVTPALPAEVVDRWFTDAFAIAEFAVRAAAQKRSIGTRLQRTFLEGLPHATALAMTHQDDNPAVGFYLKRGWRILAEDFRFYEHDARRVILGIELPREER